VVLRDTVCILTSPCSRQLQTHLIQQRGLGQHPELEQQHEVGEVAKVCMQHLPDVKPSTFKQFIIGTLTTNFACILSPRR
jgi:hypothetical protein